MPAMITYEWEPDPDEMAARMWTVADALRDPHAPLVLAAQQTREDIEESFRSESAPDGQKWDSYTEKYQPVADAHPNISMLRQDSLLFDAATDEDAFVIRGDTLFYDTSGWPVTAKGDSYGWFHQEGVPDRHTKGGSLNPLPQREFVGVTGEGETFIFTTFMQWFDRSVDLFVHRKTGRLSRRSQQRDPLTGRWARRSEPMAIRPGRRG